MRAVANRPGTATSNRAGAERPPDIVVLGAGKTGTSAVYDRIKQAVADRADPPYYLLFEPDSGRPLRALRELAPERPILTKIVFERVAAIEPPFDRFARRVMTVRDPRDILVSRFLFRSFSRRSSQLPDAVVDRYVDAIRAKEADPASRSLWELMELADELGVGRSSMRPWSRLLTAQIELERSMPWFVSHYEDFVAGDLAGLEQYLGVPLARENRRTDGWLGHIARSLGAGEWRHWMTPADIDRFRPYVQPFIDRFGYPDWDLAPEPSIDPATGSEYVLRKRARRATQVDVRAGRASADRADLDALASMAEDGDPVAGQRLAAILHEGRTTRRRAVDVARRAALQGHVPSMVQLAEWGPRSERELWEQRASRWKEQSNAMTDQITGAPSPTGAGGPVPVDAQHTPPAKSKTQRAADAAYAASMEHLLDGRYHRAERMLLDVLDNGHRAAQSVFLLGIVQLAKREFGPARQTIDRAYALKPWVRELDELTPDIEAAVVAAAEAHPDWLWPRYDQARRACFTPGMTFDAVCRAGILGNGTSFVQVGANDGVTSDPIRPHVVGSAWTGLLVEPLPHVFARLVQNYEGVAGLRFANAAVSGDDGPIRMFLQDQGRTTLASIVPDRNALSRAGEMVEVEVPGRPLMSLVAEHGIERLDLLQIDTEGFDFQVLRQLDFGALRPKAVHMEFYCLPLEERMATFELLRSNGFVYRFLERDLLAVDADAAAAAFGACYR